MPVQSATATISTPPENKLGTMKISRLILSMSIPIMISMLVQAMYNIVDSIYVARYDVDALTALSMAFPVQNLMIAVGVGASIGTNACLSQALGAKKFVRVNRVAMQAILLALLGSLVFICVGLAGIGPFMRSQTTIGPIIRHGSDYLFVVTVFSQGLFMQIMMEKLLQSTGKSIYFMITQLTGAVINIILDPIMIFGYLGCPAMGVTGAAAATVIGQYCASLLGLWFNLRVNTEIEFRLANLRPDWRILGKILSIGIPSMLMTSILSFTTVFLNRILISFTKYAVAVFGAYFKLQSFVFMPIFGLNNGIIPIVAYNYGARRKDRIKEAIFKAALYATIIMLAGLAVFHLFPRELLGLFNANDEMIAIGVPALRILSLCFIFAGFCIISMSVFTALGKAMYSLITTLVRQVFFLIPAAWLLSLLGNLDLIWFSFTIAEVASVLAILYFHVRVHRMLEKI
ncbi:MAG: MATE family efflux transporter [Fusobacteriaceae bacterium]|jgi:putative MATE family efflux protein|nr:MATE family efflux transporter [Fusobacteriaceae bacterium]